MQSDYELLKVIGYIFIYPIMVVFMSISIAKWHFTKDIKKQYFSAKIKVATDLNIAISNMLVAMWGLAHIHQLIKSGKEDGNDPKVIKRKQDLLCEIQKNSMDSYLHLGQAGIYFGINIVEKVSQFQSELNYMISENDFKVFDQGNWDNYRREKILPVLGEVHKELKGTVIDGVKSFRLYRP